MLRQRASRECSAASSAAAAAALLLRALDAGKADTERPLADETAEPRTEHEDEDKQLPCRACGPPAPGAVAVEAPAAAAEEEEECAPKLTGSRWGRRASGTFAVLLPPAHVLAQLALISLYCSLRRKRLYVSRLSS